MTRSTLAVALTALIAIGGLAGSRAGSITNELVVHLAFDNALSDSSGRNNHGTAVGTPGFAVGLIGSGALSFSTAANGSSFNYVTLGVRPDLNFAATNDFTVSFWAKLAGWTGDPAFLSNKQWVSGANTGWVVATGSDGRLQWNYTEVSPNTRQDYDGPGGTFTAGGGWRHLAISFDRDGNARSYVDGILVDTRSIDATPNTIDSGLPTNIGQDGSGTYTDGGAVGSAGQIDDLGIWRRELSGAEINRIYQAGLQGTDLSQVSDGSGTNLIGYWSFATSNITGQVVRDLMGRLDGTIVGQKVLYQSNDVEAIWLDGSTYIQLATNFLGAPVPTRDFTVEAWVGLFSGTEYGGIMGAFQDNGGFEKGWVLGYDNSGFNFALSSSGADDGDGVLTYLKADTNYTLQRWCHVVGTYDGAEQRIYINGRLAGSATVQSGSINYPASAPYDIGAYHDDNEFFPFHGYLKEIKLYNTALGANQVLANFQATSNLISLPLTAPVLPGCTNVIARANSPFGNKRVLIIGIDGARVDSLLAADTPNLDRLATNGASSFTTQCSLGQPTVSGPGWSTLLTGVWADKHNVYDNSFSHPNYGNYPHFFARIRQAQPQAYLSSIVDWAPVNQYILTNEDFQLSGLPDELVASEAVCHLQSFGPDVLFLHFDYMDEAGHAGGFDPGNPNYLSAFNQLDGRIGALLSAVNSRSTQWGENWLVCVVSDHGGTAGGTHGGQSPEELNVPFILSGGDAIKGTIPQPVFNVNLVPTVLTYLGIDLNPAWNLDGQVTGIRTALKVSRTGSEVLVRWEGSGLLQWASDPGGPWNDLTGVNSPHTNAAPGAVRFYRLKYTN